ncbi:MAG: tripartite tricarboxylate transporter TctB family protein [Paracoccaceae bacterium]|nr:tripartite tricarboxylate transporter TctB family protein [Paracoccaceae bacterium]MDE2911870.1 tripartite tricarboxylate transporter TctB family protein [Paracoccaceae bacterium]
MSGTQPKDPNQDLSPFTDEPTGGRRLLAGICIAALALLAMLPWQTRPGSMGQTAMDGGWWAEPAVAPGVALGLTIVASAIAFLAARRDPLNPDRTFRLYGQILLIAACMVGAVMLMRVLGFALSILAFSTTVAVVGGFRGVKLAVIALGVTVAMVLMFRVGFSIWFPRPLLFKWIEVPNALQGIL